MVAASATARGGGSSDEVRGSRAGEAEAEALRDTSRAGAGLGRAGGSRAAVEDDEAEDEERDTATREVDGEKKTSESSARVGRVILPAAAAAALVSASS